MKIITLILALCVSICWAIPPITEKYLTKYICIELIILLLTFFYFIFCIILFLFNKKKVLGDIPKIDKKLLIILGISALLGAFIPNILFMNLIKHNSTSIITTLSYLSPFFTFIFAYLVLKERLSYEAIIGLIFVIIGVLLIVIHHKAGAEEPFLD